MNLQQLETFVAVAATGSFSKAAMLSDTAQPALSRQVRALEVELRETLLIRTGRGVILTEAGRRLLEHSHAILQQVAQAKEDLGCERNEPVGRIVVGLPPSLARRLTLPLINAFSHNMPKAQVVIVEGFSMHTAEWLTSGRIDLGLVYSPEPHPHIEIDPVLQERLCLVGPRCALGEHSSMGFDELGAYPLIMPPYGQIFRKLMEAQARLSQVKLNVVWEVSSVPAILDLVRGGYGYAALTRSALEGHEVGQQLVVAPIQSPAVLINLCLAQSAKRRTTPLLRCTASVLHALTRQMCTPLAGGCLSTADQL